MFRFYSKCNVSRHNPAGNVGHAAGHHGHEFRTCQIRKKRPNGHRRLRLSHENAGRDVERFRAARAHHLGHDPGKELDDDLHDSNVVKHREKRADKNDGWQYLKREKETEMRTLLSQVAENKLRTGERVTKQLTDHVASLLKDSPAGVDSQHAYRKGKLQAQTPGHGFQADGSAICRKGVGQREHGEKAENSSEASHLVFVSGSADDAMDHRSLLVWGRIGNSIALLEYLPGTVRASFCIVVDRGQRLAGRNPVSDFLVKHDSHGGIDGIFPSFAGAPPKEASGAPP